MDVFLSCRWDGVCAPCVGWGMCRSLRPSSPESAFFHPGPSFRHPEEVNYLVNARMKPFHTWNVRFVHVWGTPCIPSASKDQGEILLLRTQQKNWHACREHITLCIHIGDWASCQFFYLKNLTTNKLLNISPLFQKKIAVYWGSCDNLPQLWDKMSKRNLLYPAYLHGYQKI